MLNTEKVENGNELTLVLTGRLDTVTAPELEEVIKTGLGSAEKLIFNLNDLEYISSAGLRVLLNAQKRMNKQGAMVITGAGEEVKEIFDVTGFSKILTIV
ncbi:MAG: STAS domain-containing protein [Lachnospiraceae bacterium]|nr:STAS domain-containing protein [Lachnospiraceae bacterium]